MFDRLWLWFKVWYVISAITYQPYLLNMFRKKMCSPFTSVMVVGWSDMLAERTEDIRKLWQESSDFGNPWRVWKSKCVAVHSEDPFVENGLKWPTVRRNTTALYNSNSFFCMTPLRHVGHADMILIIYASLVLTDQNGRSDIFISTVSQI